MITVAHRTILADAVEVIAVPAGNCQGELLSQPSASFSFVPAGESPQVKHSGLLKANAVVKLNGFPLKALALTSYANNMYAVMVSQSGALVGTDASRKHR